MGELTIVTGLPLRFPELAPEVRHAVAQFNDPCPHLPRVLMLPKETRAAVAMLVAQAEDASPPAPRRVVFEWLLEINGAVRRALDEGEFNRRVDAVCQACADIPGWAWNKEALRAGFRAWPWFPSASEVATLLEEQIAETKQTLTALRRIAAAGPRDHGGRWPERVREAPPDQAEIDAVREKLTAWRREIEQAQGEVKAKRAVPSRPADPATLAAFRARNPLIAAAKREAQA